MSRATHPRRYRCIAFDEPKLIADTVPRGEVCTNLLLKAGLAKDGPNGWGTKRTVQMGKTKIFMKPDIAPLLDKPRRDQVVAELRIMMTHTQSPWLVTLYK